MTLGKPKASWVYGLVCQLGADRNESENRVACPPPPIRLPEASFPDLGPSRGHFYPGWPLLEDRVTRGAGAGAGSEAEGRARGARSAAGCAPKDASAPGRPQRERRRPAARRRFLLSLRRLRAPGVAPRLAPRLPRDHRFAPQPPRCLHFTTHPFNQSQGGVLEACVAERGRSLCRFLPRRCSNPGHPTTKLPPTNSSISFQRK